MPTLSISDFDFEIKDKIKKLITEANKRFKDRNWLINVIFWSDGDYRIELKSSYGSRQDKIEYRKADDKYKYMKYRFEQREVLEESEDLCQR